MKILTTTYLTDLHKKPSKTLPGYFTTNGGGNHIVAILNFIIVQNFTHLLKEIYSTGMIHAGS